MRMRDRPPYCIVLWQKGMRLCWMEKTDCLLKSLTYRSPHSPSSFLTNTLTHPIFTQTCRLFKVPAVKKRVVAHWKHVYLFRHWKCCYSMLSFLFLEGAFFDFCGSRCINQGYILAEGWRLGRQTEHCLWKFRAFVFSRTPLICETCKCCRSARRRRPRDWPANRRPGAGGS